MKGFSGQIVALGFFFANGKQSHSRRLCTAKCWTGSKLYAAEHRAEINFTHHRKLFQIMRLAIHIRANIQQHCRRSGSRGKNRRERRAIDAGQRTQHHFCRCHGGAGVAGGNKAIGLPFAHQPQTDAYGGVALGANSLHCLVLHGDALRWHGRSRAAVAPPTDDGQVRI